MKTQDIKELVDEVLATFRPPWPRNITDQVCLSIQNNSTWLSTYNQLIGIHGEHTLNSNIGRYVREGTGLHNLGTRRKAESSLIKTYSELGRSPDNLQNEFSSLRSNLNQLRRNTQEELTSISQIDEEVAIAQNYLVEFPLSPDSIEYNHLRTYVTNYDTAITGLIQQSETEHQIITSGSYILPGTVSYFTGTYPQVLPNLLNEFEALRQTRDDREVVYQELRRHNNVIADSFLSAWQTLEAPAIDPARGPAFLMRETITQFFHHFAPNDLVETKDWWKPHDERTRITRAHRIRFIFEEQIIDSKKSRLVEVQLKELKDLYGKLNQAHSQAPIEINHIKPLLYAVQELFKNLLQVMKPPTDWV